MDAVRLATVGQTFKSPLGVEVTMLTNHRVAEPVKIGEVQADGQFSIVYQSEALPPKPRSSYVEASKGKMADWFWRWLCGACTAPRFSIL